MFERSFHFIPAHKQKYFAGLEKIGADSIVFDLEDGVPICERVPATKWLDTWLLSSEPPKNDYVRLCGLGEGHEESEKALLKNHPALGVVLPKVETVEQLIESAKFYRFGSNRRIIILIESAQGLANLLKILEVGGVYGVGLGLEDFLSESMFTEIDLLKYVQRIRTEIALQCDALKLLSIDTISMDLLGDGSLQEDVLKARSCGMRAKFSIHPAQVNTINRLLSPSVSEIKEAHQLLNAVEKAGDTGGYVRVDGLLITPPKLKKATSIIQFVNHHEKNS